MSLGDAVRRVRFQGGGDGDLTPAQFAISEDDPPPLAEGHVRVKCVYLSLDPYVRLKLRALAARGDVPGQVVGQIVESRSPAVAEGAWVSGELTWATYADARPEQLSVLDPHPDIPLHHYVGMLGLSGLTAYFGVTEVCRPTVGDRLVASGASGGVGQVAVQIARSAGARVLGTVSSATKAALLHELGVEAVVYREQDWSAALRRWAPNGVDIYFDNVWGSISEVVIPQIRPRGLIALCGQVSGYGSTRIPPLDIDWYLLLTRSLTLRGFRAVDYFDRYAEARRRLADLYLAGELRQQVEIVAGLEAAPEAFCRMLCSGTVGKTTVALALGEATAGAREP